MKFIKVIIIISVVTLFATACNNTTSTNQTSNIGGQSSPLASPAAAVSTPIDEFAAARAIYNGACIKCHMENGEGGVAELDEGETLKVPSFKKGHALRHTDEQFAKQITNGGDGMPAFKSRLTPEQINELVRFVRKEFQSDVATKEGSSGKPASGHD